MKNLIALTVAVSCVSFSAVSQAVEHCPELKKIEENGSGIYRSDGQKGAWAGIWQGIVADKAPVDSFQMALLFRKMNHPPLNFSTAPIMLALIKRFKCVLSAKMKKRFLSSQTETPGKRNAGLLG